MVAIAPRMLEFVDPLPVAVMPNQRSSSAIIWEIKEALDVPAVLHRSADHGQPILAPENPPDDL